MEPLLKNLKLADAGHLSLNEPFVTLDNEIRANGVRAFMAKLDSGEYITEPQPCLCDGGEDILISELDRYGIPLKTVLCKRCGTMRSDPYYTQETLNAFYQNEYRAIYTGKEQSTDDFFEKQVRLGLGILNYVKPHLRENAVVYEVGAGAGGILEAFNQTGYETRGCDLGAEYIKYGITRGVKLHEGDYTTMLPHGKADLLILNHLLEHIKNPVSFLTQVQALLKPDGLIFIGVPGLMFYPAQYRSKLLFYLQNAHCYHYCLQTLQLAASHAGLSLVCGDEKITSLFRKGKTDVMQLPSTPELLIALMQKSQQMADKQHLNEQKNKALSERVAENKVSLSTLKTTLKDKNSEIKAKNSEIKTKNSDIKDRTKELATVQAELNKRNKELATIKGSFGWRFISFWRKCFRKTGISKIWKACSGKRTT